MNKNCWFIIDSNGLLSHKSPPDLSRDEAIKEFRSYVMISEEDWRECLKDGYTLRRNWKENRSSKKIEN